jgi:hypothetical protein
VTASVVQHIKGAQALLSEFGIGVSPTALGNSAECKVWVLETPTENGTMYLQEPNSAPVLHRTLVPQAVLLSATEMFLEARAEQRSSKGTGTCCFCRPVGYWAFLDV